MNDLKAYLALKHRAEIVQRGIDDCDSNIHRLRLDCDRNVTKLMQEREGLVLDLAELDEGMKKMEEIANTEGSK